MAARGTTGAPTTAQEGLQGVARALTEAMTAPDAAQYMPVLEQMLKATIGIIQHAGGRAGPGGQPGAPGAPPGGPPGGSPGPGMPPAGIGALMGQGPQPMGPGGSGPPSLSGASSEDIRRLIGAGT